MSIEISSGGPALSDDLVRQLSIISLPTIGHYLEHGFVDPDIRCMVAGTKVVGRAVTVRITSPDSTLVHKATEFLSAGDVLLVDVGGERRHAPVGEMVAYAARASGAIGIVVDGVCVDLPEIREMQFPIFARGTSLLTTKLHGINTGSINLPVSIGGVVVNPGDLVCGDENGLLVLTPAIAAGILDVARADDENETELKARMDAGEKLPALTSANKILKRLNATESR